jgi:hypothetical protein
MPTGKEAGKNVVADLMLPDDDSADLVVETLGEGNGFFER